MASRLEDRIKQCKLGNDNSLNPNDLNDKDYIMHAAIILCEYNSPAVTHSIINTNAFDLVWC